MTGYRDIEFEVVRQADKQVWTAFEALRSDGHLPWGSVNLGLRFGVNHEVTAAGSDVDELLQTVLAQDSEVVLRFTFKITQGFSVALNRPEKDTKDTVRIHLGGGQPQNAPQGMTPEKVIKLEAALRRELRAFNYQEALGAVLTEELRQHYQHRESELSRLQAAITKAEETVLRQSTELRKKLEEEYDARRQKLDDQYEELKAASVEEAQKRESELDGREKALEERLAEAEKHDSRYARRQIRRDLKEEFSRRSKKFELTEGTRQLRRPIFYFVLLLLVVFGAGFVGYSLAALARFSFLDEVATSEMLSIGIKQIFFGLAFAATSMFYLRWNNNWFQQHAEEEFYLKRLELDLDRASWVVEMALEWKEEKGTELPPELLSRLTAQLFGDRDSAGTEDLHPADQLASAILGAAANTKIKVPGGEIVLDKKSIQALEKMRKAD